MILRRPANLSNWPLAFGELDEMRRGMERLFGSMAGSTGPRTSGVYPAVNLSENLESVFVRAELPGIKPADLEITMENDTLTVAGERTMHAEKDNVGFHRREREWGKFRRSLTLPVHVDPNNVQARYLDGILTVTLAKAPEARPKQIPVQVQS